MADEITTTPVVAQATTKPYQSKTLWIALIMTVAAFFPPVQTWISANPAIFTMVMGGVFAVLRVVTKGKIQIG